MFMKVCRSFGLSVGILNIYIAVVPCVGMCPLCLTDGAPESQRGLGKIMFCAIQGYISGSCRRLMENRSDTCAMSLHGDVQGHWLGFHKITLCNLSS